MSADNHYQSLVAQLPTTPESLKWIYKLVKPPIYEIKLARNHLSIDAYYQDGTVKHQDVHSDFSSNRMLMADFDKAVDAMATLLQKFPRHPWMVSSFARVDIVDEWEGGLSMIEQKAIGEMIRVACANYPYA